MRPITQPEIDAELAILEPALEEMNQVEIHLEENEFDAKIQGNVSPRIVVEFNPRGQSQLRILKVADKHNLRVVDVWQLERDLSDNIVRMRFKP